jgi:hypothetical protein
MKADVIDTSAFFIQQNLIVANHSSGIFLYLPSNKLFDEIRFCTSVVNY